VDQLRAIETFVAVAKGGSLSAASRRLGVPLTTVSRQLAALEDHLGASLVARTTRRLALTSAGRSYLEACERLLADLEAADASAGGREGGQRIGGEVVVTAPVVFGRLHVLPILIRFLEQFPKIDARVMFVDRVIDLAGEGVDIAVRVGELPSSSLVATRVGGLRLLTCAAPRYLRSHSTPARPSALSGHDCIAFATMPGGVRWVYSSKEHGRSAVRVAARLSVNTAEAAVDAAASGLGITRVLSYQAEHAIARRRLVPILDEFDDTVVPVHVVHRSTRQPKPQARRLIDYMTAELRTRLSGPNKLPRR